MEFGLDYLYYFHYSDSRGYLIFCCHSVATIIQILSLMFNPEFDSLPTFWLGYSSI